jgi:copper transport protein
MSGCLRLLGRLLLVLALWGLPQGQVWAHASLIGATPQDGASLAQAPDALILRFDEAVTLISLRVVGPTGEVGLVAPSEAAGGTLLARLPPGLANGTYLTSWRVISADGHPLGGTLAFGIGGEPRPRTGPEMTADARWTWTAKVLRFLFYAAFAVAVGGVLFRALVEDIPGPLRRRMGGAALTGIGVAGLSWGVQGGIMLDGPFPAALFNPATWQAAVTSTLFDRAAMSALGLALAAASLCSSGRALRLLGLLGALVAAIGLSRSGHAATGGWVGQLLLVLHVLAMAYWVGAFWPLLILLVARRSEAVPALRRFAALAIPTVAVLILTGAAQAARHLPDAGALVTTTYGQLVLAKVAGALLLLMLAALNHIRFTPALAAGRPRSAARLSRNIRAELVAATAVLGVTSVLTMTSPHPNTATPPAHHAGHWIGDTHPEDEGEITPTVSGSMDTQGGAIRLQLAVSPGRAGRNQITVWLDRVDGKDFRPAEVWIKLSQERSGVLGIRRQMRADGPGRFKHDGTELALPGRWTARVEVLISDFEQASARLSFNIAAQPNIAHVPR